jgi:SAM-dependent methyltransferase
MTLRSGDDYVRFLDRTSTRPGKRHHALGLLGLGPGERCLDVGCGLGEDARAIREMSGAEVVGIDLRPRMAAEARSRSAGLPGSAFVVADAIRLPFADSVFDAAWVKRALMHMAEPAGVLREMARVVRPGRRVVAVEPDLEAVLLDSAMMDVTRRLLALHAGGYASPWVGRQLRRLMGEAGLADVQLVVEPLEITNLADAEAALRLLSLARSAADRGIVEPHEAAAWEGELTARDDRGQFACHALVFVASGRRA